MSSTIEGYRPVQSIEYTSQPIALEEEWRSPGGSGESSPGIFVLRWQRKVTEPIDVSNAGLSSLHCVALNLKCTSVDFDYAGRRLIRGRVTAGVAHVAAPGLETRARFAMPCDVLHLYVSQRVLRECYEDLFSRAPSGDVMLGDGRMLRDPVIERLSQALAVSQTDDAGLGRVFADSVSLAIVSRLMSGQYASPQRGSRGVAELPRWRMTRVVEYVDAHLADPIGLEDMANSVGLSSMHFAAQFRKASGLRPHEYLQRRRIEHAQSLLLSPKYNVLDIALSCGFRSQAHFTTVFKKFVGNTPHSWRKNNDVS